MIHERLYSVPALAFFSVLLIGWYIAAILQRRARLAKLGDRPPMVPYYLPFGWDTLFKTIEYSRRYANFDLVRENIKSAGAYTFHVRAPGVEPIITVDPENIKAILATQFADFGKGEEFHNAWKFFLGDGIFNADGHTWSEARALLRPQFHKQSVSDLHVFEDHISKMIGLLPKDGSTIDLMPWWFRFTLDASTDYLFGESVESLLYPKTAFAEAFSRIQEVQTLRSRIGPFWRLYHPKNFSRAMRVLNDFVEPFVERAILERQENVTAAKEAAGEKINFTDSLSQFTSDRKVLRDQLVSTLLAGRDTTACTLSWLFYEFAYHPDIYAKLREEVLETLGPEGRPTYEDLKSMKYMQYCLNEVLRLYPIVPFNVRTALKDTSLPHGGGPYGLDPIAVPKDTPCGYCPFIMQRRTDLFGPTVNDFQPERWATWTPVPWTYIPFNGGPRICLGQNFALTEMAYATCRMCQTFVRVEERSGLKRGEVGFRTDIILSPLGGVKIGLIKGEE